MEIFILKLLNLGDMRDQFASELFFLSPRHYHLKDLEFFNHVPFFIRRCSPSWLGRTGRLPFLKSRIFGWSDYSVHTRQFTGVHRTRRLEVTQTGSFSIFQTKKQYICEELTRQRRLAQGQQVSEEVTGFVHVAFSAPGSPSLVTRISLSWYKQVPVTWEIYLLFQGDRGGSQWPCTGCFLIHNTQHANVALSRRLAPNPAGCDCRLFPQDLLPSPTPVYLSLSPYCPRLGALPKTIFA